MKEPEGQEQLSRRKWKDPEKFESKNKKIPARRTKAYIHKELPSQELKNIETLWKQKKTEVKENLPQEMRKKKKRERD